MKNQPNRNYKSDDVIMTPDSLAKDIVDWIRPFLKHSMEIAERIVFLVTVNHLWTKARLRDIKESGFGIRRIILIDTPESFPQSGFQLGVIELKKGYRNEIQLCDMTTDKN